MNIMNPEVDRYLRENKRWREELAKLRAIILDCQLTEDVKWRSPCYTLQAKNVVLLGVFKEYCVLTFFKGALLQDPHDVLRKPGENTRAARLIRFTSVQEIIELEPVLKSYIQEAIGVERADLKVMPPKSAELTVPEEFQSKLAEDPALKAAFGALTPGRQRAYILHFSAAKQSRTRASRVEKCVERILDGKGLNDCTCGRSRKPPRCDGSHNEIR